MHRKSGSARPPPRSRLPINADVEALGCGSARIGICSFHGIFKRPTSNPGPTSHSGESRSEAETGALDARFIDGILEKTGFPVTGHNRSAICAMLHVMLLTKAYEYIAYDKPEAVAKRFVESHPLLGANTSLADLLRVVEDAIAAQPACAPYMRGEHQEAESVLLDVAAHGGGMFEHGPSQPLSVYGEV
jgi:hypothetical protein